MNDIKINKTYNTEYNGKIIVLEKITIENKVYYKIKFIDTGNTKIVYKTQILSGMISNCKNRKTINIGDIYKSNSYGEFKIKEKIKGGYICEFIDTGWTTKEQSGNINKGNIKDRLYKSICGVGCIGEYKKTDYLQEYEVWGCMIGRCYNPNNKSYKSYGAKGVRVDKKWHNFTSFVNTMHLVDNWDYNKFKNHELELDKDIKNKKVKLYSIQTCTWATIKENKQQLIKDIGLKFKIIFPDSSFILYQSMGRLERLFPIYSANIAKCIRGERHHTMGLKFTKLPQLTIVTENNIKEANKILKQYFKNYR